MAYVASPIDLIPDFSPVLRDRHSIIVAVTTSIIIARARPKHIRTKLGDMPEDSGGWMIYFWASRVPELKYEKSIPRSAFGH
jgi:hypothetical protein